MLGIALLLLVVYSSDATTTQSAQTTKKTLYTEQAAVFEKAKAVEGKLLRGITKGQEAMEGQAK